MFNNEKSNSVHDESSLTQSHIEYLVSGSGKFYRVLDNNMLNVLKKFLRVMLQKSRTKLEIEVLSATGSRLHSFWVFVLISNRFFQK